MSSKPIGSNGESGGGNNEDLSDWTKVKLKFAPQPGKVCFGFVFHVLTTIISYYFGVNINLVHSI